MNKITLKDIFIFLFATIIAYVSFSSNISIDKNTANTIFTTLFTLVAFLFSIASLSVSFWGSDILSKLRKSGYYLDFIYTLKRVITFFIFTGL